MSAAWAAGTARLARHHFKSKSVARSAGGKRIPLRPAASLSTQSETGEGYQSMGSFHSENIDELRAQSQDVYCAPPIPLQNDRIVELSNRLRELEARAQAVAGDQLFGSALTQDLFMIEDGWTFVNHGAFGGSTRLAFEYAAWWREYSETQPLRYFDRALLPNLTYSLREAARFVGAEPIDTVLVQNATHALNSVVNSVAGGMVPGDRVLMLDTGYGSVKRMAQEATKRVGAELDIVELPLPFPAGMLGDEAADLIVECMEKGLKQRTKLVVIDHTTSNTAINMPIERLTATAHDAGATVLVDGAHGLLAQPLDMESVSADFYISNAHKWLSAPKGSGLLWTNPRHRRGHPACTPPIISHGYGTGEWSGFAWDGCRDYASALAIPVAIQVWEALGVERTRAYMRNTIIEAADTLSSAWVEFGGGETIAPMELHGPMALVSLPRPSGGNNGAATSTDAKRVQDALHFGHRVECPVKCVGGKLYVRVSAHVYNDQSDYQRLAESALAILGYR